MRENIGLVCLSLLNTLYYSIHFPAKDINSNFVAE